MQPVQRFPLDRDDFRLRARFRHGMRGVSDHASLLVACSGGCDSMALLALCVREAPSRHWRLVIGHVDHALRPDSSDDAAFVSASASALGLEARVTRLAASPPAGVSIEGWARAARRGALRAMAAASGATLTLLAHTEDDQAETVLLNLLRGSGLYGLTAMRGAGSGFRRPLLRVARAELRAFASRHQLAWREDASNQDRRFLRNRVRLDLLPILARDFTPGAAKLLARTARSLQPVRRHLETEVRAAWEALRVDRPCRGIRLERPQLASYDRAVIEGCLRLAVKRLRGSARDLKQAHLGSLTDAVLVGRPARFHLPHRIVATVDSAAIHFELGDEPRGAIG
ncbi:MAG: tRNA lysidine(34) synthetase TilS [Candidatus Eisenbacteria bacterium]